MAEAKIAPDTGWWQRQVELVQAGPLPGHVAIIMDGNGRWARQRGLPRIEGHRASIDSVRDIIRATRELGIKYLTLFAFSTENWKRPAEEVGALMELLVESVEGNLDELIENGVRVEAIGRLDELPASAQQAISKALQRTRHNDGLILILALNYGGRRELTDAMRQIAREVAAGRLDPDSIDQTTIAAHLYTSSFPDPDLLIRTSGEFRLSNFLLWQAAYSEFWTTDVRWPDFRREQLLEAIKAYQRRERRFGGLGRGDLGCYELEQ